MTRIPTPPLPLKTSGPHNSEVQEETRDHATRRSYSVTPLLKACAQKRPCDLTKSLWEEFFGELGQRNLTKLEGVTAREEHPVLQCQHTYGSRKPEKILNKKEN